MRYKSHRNLLRWFLEDRRQLPAAYVASCEKFFKSLEQEATSHKPQASSLTSKSKPDIG
jgi:hypothetical protein